MLAANLDDMPGEAFGYLMEQLMAQGALDVSFVPMTMKKSRPGVMVQVIAKPEDEERLAKAMLRESSTLGVRVSRMKRYMQGRSFVKVETPYGAIEMKVAAESGRACPEFEQVRAAAQRCGVPYLAVYNAAMAAFETRNN